MNRIYKLVKKLDLIAISLKKNALHTRFKGYSSYFVYVVHNVLSDCTVTSGHSRHLSMSAKLNEMGNSLGLWPCVFSCWTLMRVACAGESSLNLQKRENSHLDLHYTHRHVTLIIIKHEELKAQIAFNSLQMCQKWMNHSVWTVLML